MMQMHCHDTESRFSPAFDGRLEAEERRAFEAHLGFCARCAAEYARYESLFTAVRSLPSTTTSRPAPLPAGASSFVGARRALGLGQRLARVGAAAALLVGVGFAAYELGHASRREAPRPVSARAEVEAEIDAGVPAKMPGGYLHRLVRGTKNLGLMVETAGAHSSETPDEDEARGALRVIDDFVRRAPLDEDARRLRSFDNASLRGYTGPVHAFASEVSDLVSRARVELERPESSVRRLDRVRSLLRSGSLRRHVVRLEPLAELYPLPPRSRPSFPEGEGGEELAPHRALSGSVELLVCGDRDNAGRLLLRALSGGDPGTRRLAQSLAFGNRIEVKGLRFRGFEGAAPAPAVQFRFALPREAARWFDAPSFRREAPGRGFFLEFPEGEFEIMGSWEQLEIAPPVLPGPPRGGSRRRL